MISITSNNENKKNSAINTRQELIFHYLEQADEALISAQLWYRARNPNSYINKLLFTYMYSMLAMLLADGFKPLCRQDILKWFEMKFTQQGKVPEDLNANFQALLNHLRKPEENWHKLPRNQSNEMEIWLEQARMFVSYAKKATSQRLALGTN